MTSGSMVRSETAGLSSQLRTDEGEPGALLVAGAFILFVAAWTAFGALVFAGKALHGDVVEAYAWGKEFRFGYNQHPPFWAWIAGAWFLLWPRTDWAFNLLAVLNSAVGLLGAWRLVGLFAQGERRLAATLLLLFTPLYTFACYKYNANTIFLSLWPWTLFFFVRAMQDGRRADAVWFGLMMGLSFESKYYAVVLAITCLLASAIHPRRRAYWRTWLPWISVAVCFLVFLPHLVWLATTTAPPVDYAESLIGRGHSKAFAYAVNVVVASVLFQSVVIAAIAAATRRGGGALLARPPAFLAVLVIAPVLLTGLFGLVFDLKVSSNMVFGVFPLAPLLLIACAPRADLRRLLRIAATGALGLTLLLPLAAPLLASVEVRTDRDPATHEPVRELAAAATSLWQARIGTPLGLVAGTDPFENSITFYSKDDPSSFIDFSTIKAPWVTPARLARQGLLVACVHGDGQCMRRAAAYLTPGTQHVVLTLAHRFRGWRAAPMTFDLFLVPPRSG